MLWKGFNMSERIYLKPHMTKEEYTAMILQDDPKFLDHWDIVPCDCEYKEACTGWKASFKNV
jgi:hypothetical protein